MKRLLGEGLELVSSGDSTPLRLRPVRMKSSLYLLIPKGISEILELDEGSECTLATERKGGNTILRYSFGTSRDLPQEANRTVTGRKHHPKSSRVLETEAE